MPYIKGKGKGLLIAAVLAFLGVAVFALPALAQVDLGLQYGTEFGLTTTDIRVTIGKIINAFLGLLGIIAVLIVLYAGFLWMTAGGDAQKIQKAKRWLINGVIGLIIILSAYAIASFILRAIIGEGEVIPGGGPPGCPPGQTCTIPPGGTTGFRVQSIVPYGPGPGENGWPKNYSIVASFNADVAAATVTDSSFMVWQCNERIDGGGDPQPFDESVCSPITGTRTVEENRITFKPDSSPEDDPTDFEGEYWYMARAVGVDITDTTGRVLVCLPNPPGEEGDISSVRVQRDLCDRAMAFNDLRDVEPPEVRINSPASAPAYCAEQIPVIARATDDFLPSRVDFRIDGGTDGLVDGDFSPMSSESNTELDNPFVTSQLFIDTTVLVPGTTYTLTATAWDPVPQSSETVEREFTIAFTHCCNGELDADLGETGIDCGGECDGCAGDACTEDEDCASGFCDPATGRCADRPVIELMSPDAAGVGTLITISGQFFGDRSGTVVFLGSDTDGDGEVADDDDDVVAVACSPDAWSDTEIKVEVPVGAVTGPLEVYTDAGATDRTDDDHGALLGAFVVNSDVLPGICWLDPSTDTFGQEFVIHGAGFGATDAASYVRMGGVTIDVAIGGWSDSAITAITPATLAEGVYPVKVVVGALETNTADFTLRRSSSEEGPRIVELVPTSGSVGTYVTINGTGFGSRKGLVRFIQVADTDKVSRADDPSCDNNWNDNYIIVKVPDAFGLSDEDKEAARGIGDWVTTGDYFVEVETAAPSQTSNRVDFTVNTDPLASGMCSITPDNGPPGTRFTIVGEAFGDIWSAAPESLVHFYVDAVLTKPVSIDPLLYESWDDTSISAHVPGDYGDRATWPNSGPVHVVANNIESSNSIPFMVQDCNEEGECAEGTICCTNGACQESCEPEARNSAFGWWFSTDVLPTWPQVVRRSCGDADEGTIQSPSPYANSVDACKNVLFAVQFTVDMSDATLELDYTLPEATLVGIECGDGTSAVCPEEGGEVPLVTADTVSNDDTFWFRPNPAYNEGTGYLKENFWYRFTVVSDPKAGYGITDMEGRYLDGDFDRKPGGSYTWKFRVSGDVEACAVESLVVWPSRYVIDHEGAPPSPEDGAFMSVLTGNNCNSLVCDAADIADYDITWDEESDIIDPALTLLPSGNHCEQALEARRETPSEDPALLWAYLDPEGETVTVSNSAEVSVAFADPRVVEVFPADDCTEACTNAAIGAKFNIGMDGTTFSDNVSALRCRNESCNPPFEPFGVIRSLEYITEGVGADEEVIGFELVGDGAAGVLEPSTYYMIRIHGEEDGVLSASQVPLVGLNAEGWYEWKFRTKDDPTACEVDRTEVTPASATLFYVGQRLGLSATPYGPPDECSSGGQRLMAVNYNWMWDIAPNPVLEDGFIRTNAGGWSTDPGDVENTAPTPKQGCTSDCLLVGSQRDVPQCGNGDIDTGEDCDGGVGCSDRCLWEGTPDGTCGNGVFELGENCEASIDDVTGDLLFPPGCKDPAEDGTGCIWLGASLAGSNCGNGVLSDGEACDDGNRRDGDGCSSECLHEGTYPACPPDGGVDCVSVCGDGTVQPGEDRDCDTVGRGEVAPGCSIYTCTKVGTDISPECDPAVPGCCNGVIDTGEECDDHNIDSGDGCSSRCLHEGSSIYHATPSFCGDTFVGLGEHSQCEADITLDINIDNYQGVVAANYDPEVSADTTSTVSADCALPDCLVNPEDVGTAEVMLSCTCDTEDEPDVYCNGLAADYACADSGCCVARPRVASMVPAAGTELSCRNVPVIINFTKLMDANSVKQHLYVGYDNWDYFAGGAGAAVDCPEGVLDVPPLAEARTLYVGHEEPPGFLRRIWNRVAKFFREKIIYPVFGAPPDEADAGHDGHDNYCVVEGNLVTQTIDGGLPTAYTRAIFTPRFGFPANKWIRVQVSEEAESLDGVSVIQDRRHFATPEEPDICAIASVTVDPISDLFASREEGITRPFTAIAKSDDGTIITQVEGQYEWDWDWLDQPDSDPYISPIVVAQDAVEANIAAAWVRGTQPGDLPAEYTPIDGEAVITAKATVTRTLDGEITEPDDRPVYYGTSDIIVMLCDNPWPRWQECSGDTIDLPWDYPGTPSRECMGQGRVWYPFFDSWSNTKFYYCRDATSGGDTAPALPAIKADAGDIVRLIEPAPGIMREYLFTFDTDLGPISTVNEWSRDAIGFRIMGNPAHLGISDWYDGQSFRGAPAPLSVSGYDALQEGRTVYTNAASVTDTGDIYTNVSILSFNDGASAETVSVFNQILNRVDFNRNLDETNICYVTSLDDPITTVEMTVGEDASIVSCVSDLDCIGAEGAPSEEFPIIDIYCDAPKMKLGRDVRRWSDMHEMRDILLRGSFPQLVEGTFLRSRTYSAWPSWQNTLGNELGAALPSDPLNRMSECTESGIVYDQDTCWSAPERQFKCGSDSHIYGYHSVAGVVDLFTDLEYLDADWTGGPTGVGCAWSAAGCNYPRVRFNIGGLNSTDMCHGTPIGGEGVCGDGVINDGELCELGMRDVVDCTGGLIGVQEVQCESEGDFACERWIPVGDCAEAYCGDGIVQPARAEVCDDGSLNGTYGHCNSTCLSFSMSCGDNTPHPSEICDCGPVNGQYYKNGVLANLDPVTSRYICGGDPDDTIVGTCSWDCGGAGPRCGDGIVNGPEDCDGGWQETRGKCSTADTTCFDDDDCPGVEICETCPEPEQRWRRSCNPNDPASAVDDATACKWGGWTCTAPGSCGNGTVDTGEECDDGNDSNFDTCTNSCNFNVCGDGFQNMTIEACDDGPRNNVACIPEYGRNCNYCTSACRINTVSGGFCGDNIIQSPTSTPPVIPGPESCEPSMGLLDDNWICVSTKEEDQSFGRQTGYPVCSASTCVPACESRNAEPCYNASGSDNSDFWLPPGGGMIEEEACAYVQYSTEIFEFCNDRHTWSNPDHPLGFELTDLPDTCDPDDDNDGVPDYLDCDPYDASIHQRYIIEGTGLVIPAAAEICGDGIDNDCNGLIDDAWVPMAAPGDPDFLTVNGSVVDAFFPGVEDIEGVKVVVQPMVCTHDLATRCGADSSDIDAECTAISATSTCGMPIDMLEDYATATTDSNGEFTLAGLMVPSSECRYRLIVNPGEEFEPPSDLDISYLSDYVDEIEERSDRGYFSELIDIADDATGIMDAEPTLLIPIPRPGRALFAFVWDDRLDSYLDAWLSIPGTAAGALITPNELNYTNQSGHNLDDNPWGRLICQSDSTGDPTSCNAFHYSPQLMLFDFDGPTTVRDDTYRFYIHDFSSNSAGARFEEVDARVYVAWNATYDWQGKYYEAIRPDYDVIGNRYWYVGDWTKAYSGDWSWRFELRNTWEGMPPG